MKCIDLQLKKIVNTTATIFLTSFISVSYCFGQLPANTFELNGHIESDAPSFIYISYYSPSKGTGITDSSRVKNGKFKLKGQISNPTVAFIKPQNSNDIDLNTNIIFLEPSYMEATFSTNPLKLKTFLGSASQAAYDSLEQYKNKIANPYASAIDMLQQEMDNDKKDSLRAVLQPYYEGLNKADYLFFDSHPNSFVTGFLIQRHYSRLPLDWLKMYYSKMGTILQASIFGEGLAEAIRRKSANEVGKAMHEFKTTDIKGIPLSLSDYKGKYVLLDFWASWCAPCRAGNPHLKKLYSLYQKEGLEIIGISDDDSRPDAWKKAVKQDMLPWRHVLRGFKKELALKQLPNPKDLNNKFDVRNLPTQILLNKQGVIIGRFAATETAKLDKKLSEIFKQNN